MKKFFAIILICCPFFAHATLGESDISIQKDNSVLSSVSSLVIKKSVTQSSLNLNYSVSYIQGVGNIKIKEFSSNGKVFAVTWSGPRNPDLKQLLGSYFSELKSSAPALVSLRSRTVNVGDLFINTYGITGDFNGVAYISSLMPSGLTINDLTK